MDQNETTIQKEKRLQKELGVSPALAGAAGYFGLPRIVEPILSYVPHGLTKLLTSGRQIGSFPGTPLQDIAEFSRQEIKAIQRFAQESGVKVPIVASLEREGGSYFYDPEDVTEKIRDRVRGLLGKTPIRRPPAHIGLSQSSVPVAFHEIGHASPLFGSARGRRLWQEFSGQLGSGMAGNLARLALAGQVLAPPDEDASSLRQFGYEAAPALVGATMVPELIEEARASTRAVQGARRHGIGTLKALKDLIPAYSTYAAAAVAPVLATIVAKNIVQALHARGQEKTGAATPGAEVKAPGSLRTPASSAWQIGGRTPPKPKSIKPDSKLDAVARGRSTAKPPSNRGYYKDLLQSLYNPQRGYRLSLVG